MDRLKDLIRNALKEDIGEGDITSRLLIPKGRRIKVVLLLKEKGVVAGLSVAQKVFKTVKKALTFKAQCPEGSRQNAGKIIATVEGDAQSILKAERTALNLLSHLCGIATAARKFADRVKPYRAKILDTRKTIPGLRELQKYAVRIGGGYNHRMNLWDGILIKDNHIAVAGRRPQVTGLRELIETAKKKRPKNIKIEIEVQNFKEFLTALDAGPDVIMLDNWILPDIRKAVLSAKRYPLSDRPLLEVSGGVNLDNVREIAKTGIDMISIGSLTHSVKAIDMSLEVLAQQPFLW